jgi:succinate dehydrogenase flavin-adding protein (antitoxin of CptAB toxin-antitoxin module)
MKAVADQRRKRLQYLCWRRGTQEIDLIFGNFADRSLSGFSDSSEVI